MIRDCTAADLDAILAVINDGAEAYRGIIPPDRWHEPYMPADELAAEIETGVRFRAFEDTGKIAGVMGTQPVDDVMLVRHAYVRTACQRRGIGAALLADASARAETPVLVGTWAAAGWAIAFYERHGFRRVQQTEEKNALLRRYWTIPERQIETSVVLANPAWFAKR